MYIVNFFISMSYHKPKSLFAKYCKILGTAVVQWLRCCATNRKVAGSIPDGVIGIFY